MARGNEINSKRYYWMKLERNFFKNARIKKLRKLAGGDTLTIIYLKLCLLAIDNNCVLVFEGIEEKIEDELALKIEEDADNIRMCLIYLEKQGMLEIKEDNDLQLLNVNVGTETQGNVYKREQMVRKIITNFEPNSNQILTDIRDKELRDKELKDIKNSCAFSSTANDYFESFWSAYPKKKNKDKCQRWFQTHKVTQQLIETMLEAINTQKKSKQWQKDNGQFIPYPYTWLNGGAWQDEIEVELNDKGQPKKQDWLDDWYKKVENILYQ